MQSRVNDAHNAISGWTLGPTGLEIQVLRPSLLQTAIPAISRCWTKVVFHEAGHLVLHATELKKRLESPNPDIPIARPDEEEEAWFFGEVVYGIAISRCAWEERAGNRIGYVWQYA